MNYYRIYLKSTGELIAEGNARECAKQLGCSSIDTFYSLEARSRRGKNKKYIVEMIPGPDTDYPVLGQSDPIFKKKDD